LGALEEVKREVLRATDIVTLIEQYLPLKRSGRSMTACCPFHQEKTPSFHVSAERQTFKCFGCGKGGNAIDFVIEKEGVDFKAALRHLADKLGIAMPERRGGATGEDGGARERLRLFEIQTIAAEFFRKALTQSKTGGHARDYVRSRGIDEETEERFQIGWAPAGWSFLVDHLAKRGYGGAEVEKAGLALAKKSGNGWVDRFRNRLMFPIHDIMGRVVAFGGRALAKEDNPKYMNSPETPIFRKGELCYALHLAKEAARERGEVAVVEGYIDVVLAHQAGFPWMVATLGTAFRADHARILSRVASKLLVFFDGDAAGASANRRGLVEAGRAGLGKFKELRVARLPDGLDPADLVQQRGAAALHAAVKSAVSLSEFYFSAVGTSSAERSTALKEIAEILAALEDEAYRELEIASTSHRFGVPEEMVRRHVKQARDGALAKEREAAQVAAQAGLEAAANGGSSRPVGRGPGLPSGHGSSQVSAAAPAAPQPAPRLGPLPKSERWALECMLALPELVEDARAKGVLPSWFQDPRTQAITAALLDGLPIAEIEDASARSEAVGIAASLDPEKHYARDWQGVVARLLFERPEPPRVESGTNQDVDGLQQTVARKLRRMSLRRDVSVRGGEPQDVNG